MSLEKFFHLKENNTTVKTEIMAGVTSFMTMAYILAVNPNILAAAGMDHGAVFTATAVASFIGTLCMALFANYPVRSGTWNGSERLLCIHGRSRYGLFLGSCSCGSSHGRYHLYHPVLLQHQGSDLQRDPV